MAAGLAPVERRLETTLWASCLATDALDIILAERAHVELLAPCSVIAQHKRKIVLGCQPYIHWTVLYATTQRHMNVVRHD